MNEIFYVSHTEEYSLSFDGFTVETATPIRSYKWAYDIGRHNIYAPRNEAIETSVKFTATHEELDKYKRIFDRDVYERTPGTLVVHGVWKQKVYITGIDISGVSPYQITGSLKVLLLDGYWTKTSHISFNNMYGNDDLGNITGYDFPYDTPFDFMGLDTESSIDTGNTIPCHFRLFIYGNCTNPTISIGNNIYQVNVSVPSESILIIDTKEKKVILRDNAGFEENVFGRAERGEGKGKGKYIFEPLATGKLAITWDNSFGFDIEYDEISNTPPFMLDKVQSEVSY